MSKYDFEHLGAYRHAVDLDDDNQPPPCEVLLVGEDNPQSAWPSHALYPYPVGCAGYNFAENITGVGTSHQLATWRTNLCNPNWSAPKARERATALVLTPGVPWRVIVMLGRKVSRAFEKALDRYIEKPELILPFSVKRAVHRVNFAGKVATESDIDWIMLVSLPHPSGRCREWNDLATVHRARALLARVAPEWYGELG